MDNVKSFIKRANRGHTILFVSFATIGFLTLAGCQTVDRVRTATDVGLAVVEKADIEALVQVDMERQRLRRARCHNPMLTPAVISDAANDPRLGTPWIDELLGDCPQFSAFLSDLVLRRAVASGLLASNPSSRR